MIGSKFSRHFFNQSEVKPKPSVARACTFSRALCRLSVITSSFDWFTGLFTPFLIGQVITLVLRDSFENLSNRGLVFEERGKPEYPEKNLSVQSRKPTMTPSLGIEPGPHWWAEGGEFSHHYAIPSPHIVKLSL